MTTTIKPTIGRRVWFRPSAAFLAKNPTFTQYDPSQAMDAGIVYVHHDSMVNLAVCDHVGRAHMVPSVQLLDGPWDAAYSAYYCCAEWMPYQQGQARRDAAIDRAITATTPLGAVVAPVAMAQAQSATLDLASDTPLAPACDLSGDNPCEACQ